MANSTQVGALAQLFIEKEYITKKQFSEKLKQLLADYPAK
jgi:hypothetical protein